MALIQLRANPATPNPFPDEVSSPKHLVFFVDDPPKQMQIFSGIAIPMWDSEKLLDVADVLVHFGVTAPNGNPPVDWDFTATISLASAISNSDEFTFATDQCAVIVDKNTRELMLFAQIAVKGDPVSVLARFSYHVEVLSKIPVTGVVKGTIRWHESWGAPDGNVQDGTLPMFQVKWDSAPAVFTTEAPAKLGTEWAVPYSLTGLPLDTSLSIVPELVPGALDGPPAGFSSIEWTPPSSAVTLTLAQPIVDKQDFEMTFNPLA
jgi:hypothetical protein